MMKHVTLPRTWFHSTPRILPLLAALLWAAGPARSAEPAATGQPAPDKACTFSDCLTFLKETDRLTGDWGGWRTKHEERGVRYSLFYNAFYAYKNDGGADDTSLGRYSGSVDFFGMVDLEQLGLIPGGDILIQIKNNHGKNINPFVGAIADPIDDADGYLDFYIDQLYYQQGLFQEKLQVRVGYLDQQTILDRNVFANSEDVQFMNTFLDNNNATIPLAIGPGLSLFINPTEWVSFVLGMANAEAELLHDSLDTTFDGDWNFYGYFETDFHVSLDSAKGPLAGNYRIGTLIDPTDMDKDTFGKATDGSTDVAKRNPGVYVSFDQKLWKESDQAKDNQGLGWFFRYGWRPGDVRKIDQFVSSGLVYEGAIPNRNKDVVGVGFYSVHLSSDYRNTYAGYDSTETGVEAYYNYLLTPAIRITPGIQFVANPGAIQDRDNCVLGAVRARFSF